MRSRNGVLVGADGAVVDCLVEHIDFRLRKIAGANFALKEQIQLCESATTRFWNAEVSIDDAEEAKAGPKECRVVLRAVSDSVRRLIWTQILTLQFQAVGLIMYGVKTLVMMPMML